MTHRPTVCLFLLAAILALSPLFASSALAISIPTVPVGNAGNSADITGYGAVSYSYRIGTTEVTNTQYAAFLNSKAASDPLGLYNPSMGSGLGGISRIGASGSYTYAPTPGRELKPVNYVSWYDAIRFANWLHNGQGAGDTETGAYTILGGTKTPTNGLTITRNPGALWWLTREDEWYKAAYHKKDGVTGNYFDYPTTSDTAPTPQGPPGGPNSANFAYAIGDPTNAGAYANSASPYGTFDQGGNVWEWNESLVNSSSRRLRGGSFENDAVDLSASVPNFLEPSSELDTVGFRFATIPNFLEPSSERNTVGVRFATVPEPSSLLLTAVGAAGAWLLGRRRPLAGG